MNYTLYFRSNFRKLLLVGVGSVFLAQPARAQVAYECTLTQTNVNILGTDYLEISAYIESTGVTAFEIGGANFRINLNGSALTIGSAAEVTESIWDNSTNADYDDQTVTGDAVDGYVGINIITLNFANYTTVPNTPTLLGTVRIPISDVGQNSNATWRTSAGTENTEVYDADFNNDITANGTFTNPGAHALPVSLTYFNAIPQSGIDAKLTWQTATEENNRGFYVERSVDGRNWEIVNFVPSMAPGGNSRILVDYQFLDMNVYKPHTGISTWYYQLRQQDINGEEEYVGGIRAVRFNENGTAAVINVYPNPATSLVTISVKDGAPVQYTIVDMTGKSVLRGAYTQTIDVSKLQSGSYQVSVFDITGATLGTQNITVAR